MSAWRFPFVAAVSALIVVVVASRTHPGMYSDPAYQLKAVQQALDGESPDLNTLTQPDADDISRNRSERLIWWAPGTPLAAEPLMKAGVPVATVVRAVAAVALVIGAAGWVLWFGLFDLPTGVMWSLAVLFPWVRYASNALFHYTSEVLVFAAAPWVLIAALAANRRDSVTRWLVAGLLAGALYVVKYSASFVAAGVLLWIAVRFAHEKERGFIALLAATAGIAIPVALLSAINRTGGSANLLTASFVVRFDWRNVVYSAALPALALTDLDAVLRFLLMHPSRPVIGNVLWLCLVGVPGGVFLIWLVARRAMTTVPAALAQAVFVATTLAILVVWTISNGVSVEGRHVSSAAFSILPLALAEGLRLWQASSRPMRLALISACAIYVCLPLAYGPVSVAAKAWRYPPGFHPASSGLYNPLFAQQDLHGVVDRLERDFEPASDVWYLTEPMSALDLKGRAIIRDADFLKLDQLRRDRFRTTRAARIHVLLPPRFEANGKGETIRASFPQAVAWRHDAIPGSQYDRWIAELRPDVAY
jgi:hypothetical protein